MDTNFIIFFVFLILIMLYIPIIKDGMMYLVFGFFLFAIFANTQSATPIFFSNSSYLGWGALFNVFWLILGLFCLIQSYFIGKSQGLFKGLK